MSDSGNTGSTTPDLRLLEGTQPTELLYRNPLNGTSSLDGCTLEGPAIMETVDGTLQIRSRDPDGEMGHSVLWLPPRIEGDYLATWRARVVSPFGLLIIFFDNDGTEGRDLFDPSLQPRDGTFPLYHSGDIRGYHISYHANTPGTPNRPMANLRKNPGFHIAASGPIGIPADSHEWHQVYLIRVGQRIRLLVDQRVAIDHLDDGKEFGPPWSGGYLGLRQMQWTVVQYADLRVHRLVPRG